MPFSSVLAVWQQYGAYKLSSWHLLYSSLWIRWRLPRGNRHPFPMAWEFQPRRYDIFFRGPCAVRRKGQPYRLVGEIVPKDACSIPMSSKQRTSLSVFLLSQAGSESSALFWAVFRALRSFSREHQYSLSNRGYPKYWDKAGHWPSYSFAVLLCCRCCCCCCC